MMSLHSHKTLTKTMPKGAVPHRLRTVALEEKGLMFIHSLCLSWCWGMVARKEKERTQDKRPCMTSKITTLVAYFLKFLLPLKIAP